MKYNIASVHHVTRLHITSTVERKDKVEFLFFFFLHKHTRMLAVKVSQSASFLSNSVYHPFSIIEGFSGSELCTETGGVALLKQGKK